MTAYRYDLEWGMLGSLTLGEIIAMKHMNWCKKPESMARSLDIA